MPLLKEIVCLANSRKWSQRCVAGKDLAKDTLGEWVMPGMAKHMARVLISP